MPDKQNKKNCCAKGREPIAWQFFDSIFLRKQILLVNRRKGFIVRSDVEKALDVSQSTAILLLRELTDDGVLIKKGKAKNLRYCESK